MKAAMENGINAVKSFPVSSEFDDDNGMHKLVSAEAGMRGTVVALWGVTFVAGMVGWISLFDVEAAVLAGIGVLFMFSIITSVVWWLYRDLMLKRLKNHNV